MSDLFMQDGKLIKRRYCALSPYDRSFSLGDGLFETVKVAAGRPVWLEEHLERMEKSALFAGIVCRYKRDEIAGQCAQVIAVSGVAEGFLRITLSRGDSPLGRFSDLPQKGSLAIIAGTTAVSALPARAAFAPWRINETDPAVRHKTTSKFSAVMAGRLAWEKGLDELVFLNTKGELSEGIVSNIFWTKDGALFTPAVECGLLCGIARGKVMGAARTLGITVATGSYFPENLHDAESVFFTNSLTPMRMCDEMDGISKGKCTSVQAIENMVIAPDFFR